METYKTICKLCDIKISDTNFELIDAVIKEVLDVLLLKMKFDDGIQYLMCNICSAKLFGALDFKSVCLNTDHTIIPYVNIEDPSPVDLKEIYAKENRINILENKQICRLCLHPANGEYISVEKIQASTFQMYIPEINFKVTVDPIICKMCHDSLVTHVSFIQNCLSVEQRTYKDDCPVMDTDLNDSYIKTEEIEIKHEEGNEEDQEKSSETQFIKLEENIKQESDLPLHFFGNDINIDSIEQCNSEQLLQPKKLMRKRQSDEQNLEVEMYKCSKCKFEIKYKKYLGIHQLRHKDPSKVEMFNCSECEYKTVHKSNFRTHQLKHKDLSEVEMFNCSECKYKTKYKNDLRTHQLKHKDSSEVQMYKCSKCKFETKYKKYLGYHQLRHKDPSEVKMYKCNECKYKTKYKNAIRSHQLRHKDPSEVEMFNCHECKYETKYKNDLRKHQLRHKDPSKMEMHSCSECKYKTKYKSDLKTHQLRHKDSSEVQMYKCSECKFETKHKKYLEQHQLRHKDSSEVKMYKCKECGYKTKYKNAFRSHQLRDKDNSKVKMFSCTKCKYETVYKKCFRTHRLRHKDKTFRKIKKSC